MRIDIGVQMLSDELHREIQVNLFVRRVPTGIKYNVAIFIICNSVFYSEFRPP